MREENHAQRGARRVRAGNAGEPEVSIVSAMAANLLDGWKTPLPPRAVERARIGILDTVGVTVAGSLHEGARVLRRVVLPMAAQGASALIGTEGALNAADAALVNGAASHMLDFDDSNSQLHGHPSVAVLPALLAAAGEAGASGDEVLRAYVWGMELCCRLGMGVGRHQYTHGWHPTTTIGIFGGVAAAALIYGLDRRQTATALAIAASMAAGIKSNFGTMTKPLIVGHAARNAIMAAKLAREGFTASPLAFEHHHGYLNVFNRDPANYDVGRILSGWGEPFCILDMGIKQKRYPCCYACLPVLDGVERIMAGEGIAAADVARVEVKVHAIRFPHINVPQPQNALHAKFSVHYCVARVLLNGRLSIEDFEGESDRDPETRALMDRVTLSTYDRENTSGADVLIETKDGRVLETYVELARGAQAQHPLPVGDVRAKFEDNAARALGASRARLLGEALLSVDAAADIRSVLALTQPGGGATPLAVAAGGAEAMR